MSKNTVIIIGAGPAGLTAGYELTKNGYNVTIFEEDETYVGGISRTVKYKGFRFDIGGHRFFSKNEEIMNWWKNIMGEDFLKRKRVSRWYYHKKFFDYPINPFEIMIKFGPLFAFEVFSYYLYRKLLPIKPVVNLEDWFKNNFGDFLAKPFFINYNFKLWGIPCNQLSLDFAAQRIKGISLFGTIIEAIKRTLGIKGNVKSLINEFNYPKYGPGELWEKVSSLIEKNGGTILKGNKVVKVFIDKNKVESVNVLYKNKIINYKADFFLSTMPFKDLALAITPTLPKDALVSAQDLKYRDFITIALVINKKNICPDNWVYTHDEGLKPIRFQNFKNWSPFMVPNDKVTVVGLEYTCFVNDNLWNMKDDELIEQGKQDFLKLGFASYNDIIDGNVVRLRKDGYLVK